jgi:hypothetical protein
MWTGLKNVNITSEKPGSPELPMLLSTHHDSAILKQVFLIEFQLELKGFRTLSIVQILKN